MNASVLSGALALGLATAAATAASAEEIIGSAFSTGNWEGAAYTFSGSTEFSHCAVSVGYVSGDTLYLSVNSDASVTVGVESPSFRFTPGESFPAALYVDSRQPFHGTADVLEPTFLVIGIADFDGAMQALTRGRALRVEGRGPLGNFDLTGSFRALEAARSCAISQLEFAAAGGIPKLVAPPAPAASAPVAAAPPNSASDRTVLFQIATEMIAEIGVRRFRYLDAAESRDIAGRDSVFWIAEEAGLYGGAVIVPLAGAELRDSDSGDLGFVSSECQGDVATSTRSIAVDGLEGREIRGLCIEADGQIETLLTKIRIGDAALYTILAFGDGADAATSQERRRISESVAIRAANFVAGN